MDIGIAEVRKSEKNIGGAESNIEGAELSIGGAEGHPKSIQIDTSDGRYCLKDSIDADKAGMVIIQNLSVLGCKWPFN